ncbi:MAG TPA: MBL fold metallo-hydrolase [Saprospiraceae bacterium]|nr:MBL fold metallo-hydrolase [Saprospiraceae bacterium]
MITNTPKSSEVEITLIGTGGGYGESIVMKIGVDSWIIIDSCVNPSSKQPLAIEYLKDIGVDLSKIILVICTHWHNDHIKGLSSVLSKCPNAEFCFSSVHDLRKFLLLCELDYTKTKKGSISSTNEFAKCLEITNNRGNYFTRAQCNLVLHSLQENGEEFILYALSPSSKTISNFDAEISQLITEFGKRNIAIINKSPNDKSVALLLKFGNHRVLLGADLEVGKDEHEGWRHVVKHCKVIDNQKAKLYKLPHHGSHNGYLSELFDMLIDKNSILKLTPFKSNGLPRSEMMDVYSKHSEEIYLTSNTTVSKKPKKRDSSIEKIIERSAIRLVEIKYTHGIVRSRIDYTKAESVWNTEVFEGALKYKPN